MSVSVTVQARRGGNIDMDRMPSKSASGKQSRNNTILCKWFPHIFDSLRRGLDLDTHDESLRIVAYEKSHVLAILERAKLITIIGGYRRGSVQPKKCLDIKIASY